MRRTVPGGLPRAYANVAWFDTRTGVSRAVAVIARSIVWTSLVFMIFPAIDLIVSRWFADGSAFTLAEQPLLKGLREFGLRSPFYIAGVMLLLIGLHVVLPARYRFCEPHKPLFVLLSLIAGPLLVVETVKAVIGRVRPRNLLEFGGNADFTPVLQFSAACARNCSFPSGEAAAAAAMLSLLVFVPARLRCAAAIILTPGLALIALNRVFFGAHFLSDVVLGWLFTMLVMAWVWKWTEARSKRIDRFFTRAFSFGRAPPAGYRARKANP